jgi:hypothetical protein
VATLVNTVRFYDSNDVTANTVTGDTFRVSMFRGRRQALESVRSGSLTVEFNNDDGIWDVWSLASPYFGDLIPGQKVEVLVAAGTASARTVYTGRVDEWRPFYTPDLKSSVMRLEGTDCLAELAQVQLGDWSPVEQSAGARLSAMVARPELDEFLAGTTVSFEVGASTMGAFPVQAGTSALDYAQQVTRSEQGFLYASRAGVLTFKGRYTASAASNLEFRDVTSSTPPKIRVAYQGLTARSSTEDLINRAVTATQPGGLEPTDGTSFVNDYTFSIAQMRRAVSAEFTDLIVDTDFQADELGKLIVSRYGPLQFRVTSVTVLLQSLSDAAADACLTSEIADSVLVSFRGPSAQTYSQTLRVIGISDDVRPLEHYRTWFLAPEAVDLTGLFILDSSSLDGLNVLGY